MRSAVLLIVFTLGIAAAVEARQLPSTGDLFDRYARGDFSAFAVPKTPTDLDRFRQALEHDAEPWLRRGDGKMLRRRQLIVATIALEAAYTAIELGWGQGRRLIEFGAGVLRRGPADDAERRWHLAAVSLMQGAHDTALLVQQQKLVVPRFPDEPRFLLALIVAIESSTWPEPDRSEPWIDDESTLGREKAAEVQRRARMRQAITAFEDLSNLEAIRAEALLRLGYLHLRLRNVEIAIEQFEDVLNNGDEPVVRFLAHFLLATAREQLGDRANAIAAYRDALEVMPRAQSASLALASLLFIADRVEEAAEFAEAAVQTPLADDPWRTYVTGDFRLWTDRLAALREALR